MGNFHEGEVWFVGFPLEEDDTQIINRPVVVLDEDKLGVLSVKVIKHKVRSVLATSKLKVSFYSKSFKGDEFTARGFYF